jgi:putative membrane protein
MMDDPTLSADKGEQGEEDPRVRFAAERTLLAWVRTAIGLMGLGFLVARFGLFLRQLAAVREVPPTGHSTGLSLGIGSALVILGVAMILLAARQHQRIIKRLNRREPYLAPPWSLALLVSVILAFLGVALVVYLFSVGH